MSKLEDVEMQIYEQRKTVRYDIRELTVELIVGKYDDTISDETEKGDKKLNCIYMPDYQRDFTWDKKRQSKLIESIILGLPIPLIFVAENSDSSWEVVDGSQRIRTLNAFINDDLQLISLEKLTRLNEYTFKEMERSRQGKFLNTALRIIVLSEETTEQVKKDMFERINRGSDLLKPMEKRKGIYQGPFNTFIYDFCKKNQKFKNLVPVDNWLVNRQEREELLLRFFALIENKQYSKGLSSGIASHLDRFMDKKNKELESYTPEKRKERISEYTKKIEKVMDFVECYFPYGFRAAYNPQTKRAVFEAISVGSYFFLEDEKVVSEKVTKEYISKKMKAADFRKVAYTNETHKKAKLSGRVEYIIKMLAE